MELEAKPKLSDKQSHGEINDGTVLNLYKTVPYGQLTLEECQDLFRQRLEALFIMERLDHIAEKNISIINNALRGIKCYAFKTNCIIQNRREDIQRHRQEHFSHLLMRMYCVYQSNLWPWFKSNEKKLFLLRLKDQATSLSGSQFESILKGFNFNFERIVGVQMRELLAEKVIGWSSLEKVPNDIFKVHFTDALWLVSKRSVALKDGYAYLTRIDMINIVGDAFAKHLETELHFARQHFNLEMSQTRQLIESMDLVYQDYQDRMIDEKRKAQREQDNENRQPHAIDIDNLEPLVQNHYPPCMRYLHETLMADHHLKHSGRLYYGAFLRSGQVDLETAIEFWRREFTKKIPNDKFERNYKYNIRHLYGKEGHKQALSCFSCDKIINENPPGPAEKHGCPFKHFGDSNLRTMLTKHGLKGVDIDSVILRRDEKDYKGACTRYFEYTKGYPLTDTIKTPAQFYYESRRIADRPPPVEAMDVSGDQQVGENEIMPNDDPEAEFDD